MGWSVRVASGVGKSGGGVPSLLSVAESTANREMQIEPSSAAETRTEPEAHATAVTGPV
jgi:hypothetical protein